MKPGMSFAMLLAALAVSTTTSAADPPQASPQGATNGDARLPVQGKLPALDAATAWINTPALMPSSLRGKVVVIDFWTYTCINWQRSLPYVRDWYAKYKDQGLVVIGVHTPEFSFEHDLGNVRAATSRFAIDYPVAVDNGYALWRAFDNQYWPALYIVDGNGAIRYSHFGEGEYERSERVIQRLLREAGQAVPATALSRPAARGSEVEADWADLRSPESYLGHGRADGFASTPAVVVGKPQTYSVPSVLRLNRWALAGDWTVTEEAARSGAANARIALQFHARDVHLVMGPASKGAAIRFRVLVDGAPPGAAHGTDVDEAGNGIMTDQRLYQLVRQPGAIADRRLEIEFLDAGAEAFAFTFG